MCQYLPNTRYILYVTYNPHITTNISTKSRMRHTTNLHVNPYDVCRFIYQSAYSMHLPKLPSQKSNCVWLYVWWHHSVINNVNVHTWIDDIQYIQWLCTYILHWLHQFGVVVYITCCGYDHLTQQQHTYAHASRWYANELMHITCTHVFQYMQILATPHICTKHIICETHWMRM